MLAVKAKAFTEQVYPILDELLKLFQKVKYY